VFQLPFGILFTFHSQYTNLGCGVGCVLGHYLKRFTILGGGGYLCEFDLSTKRYLLDK